MFSNAMPDAQREAPASVYARVLGDDFARLHPQLQRYFGGMPAGEVGVGTGRYDHAGLRVRALRPLFALLGRRGIAFPEHGVGVPFTVRNTQDGDGALHAARTFEFPGAVRTMRDVMRVVDGRLVDRLGAMGELEVELALAVSDGDLRMDSRRLGLRWGRLRVPLPRIVRVSLEERAIENGEQRVRVRVVTPLIGEVYGYAGTFRYARTSPA
jgi:hypothetical protein